MSSERELSEVKDRHSMRLLSLPGVIGVGLERDENGNSVLTIHVDADDPEVYSKLPKQIEGHPIKIVRSEAYRKQPASRRQKNPHQE